MNNINALIDALKQALKADDTAKQINGDPAPDLALELVRQALLDLNRFADAAEMMARRPRAAAVRV